MTDLIWPDRFAQHVRTSTLTDQETPAMSTDTVNRIPAEAQAQIKAGLIGSVEQVIRDCAAEVVNGCQNRLSHPTYGYTKTKIRATAERMEGQIGLLMVLDGQAAHAKLSVLATFADPATEEIVTRARQAVNAL